MAKKPTTNSTDTPESEAAAAGGAGNEASPAGLPEAVLAVLLEESGCADPQHLVGMAKLGLQFTDAITEYVGVEGPLKDWPVEHEQLLAVVKNWEAEDEDGNPVPFTEEAFRAELQNSWFRNGILAAYADSLNGIEAKVGNSEKPPGTGL